MQVYDFKMENDLPEKKSKLPLWIGLGAIGLVLATSTIILIGKNKKQKTILSPVAENPVIANYDEPQKSISYYITTSQEFLNKARGLANTPGESLRNTPGVSQSPGVSQTPEEKQKIIATINQSLDLANQAIAFYPDDDRGFAQRANIYQALTPFLPESVNFAIQDIKEAIKLNRQNPEYHSRLAQLYLLRHQPGDFEKASLSFYNHYTLSPTESQVVYNLADSLEKAGQPQKALHYFKKLLGLLAPDDESLAHIKQRQDQLEIMISQAKLEYLTKPGQSIPAGDLAPKASAESSELIGTQELPLEQAALASQMIIAGPDMNTPGESLRNTPGVSTISINAKSGIAVIPAGQIEVTIDNQSLTNNQKIVLLALSDSENKVLFVKAKKENSWFKVGIDKPIKNDLKFKWWLVKQTHE